MAVVTRSSEGGSPRRILLVDDIEMTRMLTEVVLRGATYEVDGVCDGGAALRALDEKAYDLVLMDLDMPGIDGHAAAAAIKRRDETLSGRWATPTVVALSSRGTPEARERSRIAGMIDHIRRPIGPAALIREVARVLALCPPTDSLARTWCREPYLDLVERLGAERVRFFLAALRAQCEAMRAAIADDATPAETLRREAHDLVSVGGMLGFEALSRACFVAQTETEGAVGVIARIDAALDATIAVLTNELAGPPALAA